MKFCITSFFAFQAAGKYRQEGKMYVVQDGDIIYFKFNVTSGGKKWETITTETERLKLPLQYNSYEKGMCVLYQIHLLVISEFLTKMSYAWMMLNLRT